MPDQVTAVSNDTTAHWIAAARARESERADRLFDDPHAAVLAGRRGRAALVASEGATGGENEFLPIRTRFFDDVLRTAVDRLEQVVLLGAGLDTRAFRLARRASSSLSRVVTRAPRGRVPNAGPILKRAT